MVSHPMGNSLDKLTKPAVFLCIIAAVLLLLFCKSRAEMAQDFILIVLASLFYWHLKKYHN